MSRDSTKIARARKFFLQGLTIDGIYEPNPTYTQVAELVDASVSYVAKVAKKEGWRQQRAEVIALAENDPADTELQDYKQERKEKLRKWREDEVAFFEQAQQKFRDKVAKGKKEVAGFRDYNQISARMEKLQGALAGEGLTETETFVQTMIQLGIFVKTDKPEESTIIDVTPRPARAIS